MRKVFYIALLILCGMGGANAQPFRISCKFLDGTEMLQFNVDLQKRKAYWVSGGGWDIVGDTEKLLTMRSADNDKLVGGVYMVVDRFTGEFAQTVVSVGTDGKLYGGYFKGVCNIKKF